MCSITTPLFKTVILPNNLIISWQQYMWLISWETWGIRHFRTNIALEVNDWVKDRSTNSWNYTPHHRGRVICHILYISGNLLLFGCYLSVPPFWLSFKNWWANLDRILCMSVTFTVVIYMYFWERSHKYFWCFPIYTYSKFVPTHQQQSKMAKHPICLAHFFQ